MTANNIKHLLLGGVAFLALSGAGMWHASSRAQAADDHGHGHAHEETESSHDAEKEEHGHGHEESHGDEHAEGTVELSAEQIQAANIQIMIAGPGDLSREIGVPGKITAAADRMAQVVPKVSGTVHEIRKNLGDAVKKGEVLALIESREMAEAVAEYQAAARATELTRSTFNREKSLWEKKITAEQDYLSAKTAHQESSIRLDLAKQKLQALGHDGKTANPSRFHELKSPLDGRIIARELTLGEYIDTTHTAFTIADLGTVWVEIAITPDDLPFIKEGQSVSVTNGKDKAEGKLMFVSPAIDPETRAAKAIVELPNAENTWRSGSFVTAAIATSAQQVSLAVLNEALMNINGKPALFVKTDHGFEKRDVVTGRADSRMTEITAGLREGESVAVSNTFILKAEFGKSEAEHAH